MRLGSRVVAVALVVRSVLRPPTEGGRRRPRHPRGTPADRTAARRPGIAAETPTQVPLRGWWQILRRAVRKSSTDKVGVLAAGVAFFGFLAIFPTLIALVSLYGLVADPTELTSTVRDLAAALPPSARGLVGEQLDAVVSAGRGGLTVGLVISAVAAMVTASSGVATLVAAVNVAYDETDTRSPVRLRLLALGLTLGAMLFFLLAVALLAIAPVLLGPPGAPGRALGQVVRWALLVALIAVSLAVVYRVAPDRDAPRFRWVSVGATTAIALWILGSVGFSVYVENLGSYNRTYGALAGVAVLLLWMYLSSYVVLLGAEINAEAEQQTARDTTRTGTSDVAGPGAGRAGSAGVTGGVAGLRR